MLSLLLVSCTNNTDDIISVEGVWELTEYNVANGFDINNDGVANTNLLEEIECLNQETLIFESNGVVKSNTTFNPSIDIALVNEATNEYTFDVKCDLEGVIGFASNYAQNGNTVSYNNINSNLIDKQLHIVFKDAIKIFNSNYSEVIKTEDLILVYSRQ